MKKKIKSLEIEIKKLEASKKKRGASQMSKEVDNEEGVLPSKQMKTTPADAARRSRLPVCAMGLAHVCRLLD